MFAALVAARASSNHKATRFGGFSFFSTSAGITLSDDRHWLIRCARYRSGAYGLIILLFVLYWASFPHNSGVRRLAVQPSGRSPIVHGTACLCFPVVSAMAHKTIAVWMSRPYRRAFLRSNSAL